MQLRSITSYISRSPVAPLARTRGVERPFSAVLADRRRRVASPPPAHTVRRGQTLWGICADRLRSTGRQPSRKDVSDAVRSVARANGLANPDRIDVGQQLDLSALGASRRAVRASSRLETGPSAQVAAKHAVARARTAQRETSELAELLASVLGQRADAYRRTDPARPWQSLLDKPARVSSGFGFRKDPFTGRRQHHNGIDLAVPRGTEVHPARPGRVVFTGWQRGYGHVVIVRHYDGAETVYGHNSRNAVRKGDLVTPHTTIALPYLSRRSFQIAKAL